MFEEECDETVLRPNPKIQSNIPRTQTLLYRWLLFSVAIPRVDIDFLLLVDTIPTQTFKQPPIVQFPTDFQPQENKNRAATGYQSRAVSAFDLFHLAYVPFPVCNFNSLQ